MSRIFIVDDSKIFRFTVVKLFGFSGFDGELVEFESATELIDFLIENKSKPELLPQLILLDINMPNISGFECLHELQKLGSPFSEIKVKILSSSIDKEDISKANEFAQVEGFITKPLNPNLVQGIIQQLEPAS
ncbi:MAG: response regulator [Bacteroidia bacterium]